MNLTYCPRCDKLFTKTVRDVCNNCLKEIEEEYERVAAYLKKNRGANIQEVSDATEVSVQQITKFIREGRISTNNMPNMTVPCEVCGLPIQEGTMCGSCRSRLQKDMMNLQQPAASQAPIRPPADPSHHTGGLQIRDHRKP